MSEAKFESTQRVLNLTFAILAAGRLGLSKEQIFRSVPGYEGFKIGDDAHERLFTRDKKTLRKTGIKLVEQDLTSHDSNQDFRYYIAKESFEWPDDFSPTAAQTRLLELAANCWQDPAVTQDLAAAMKRLIALGEAPDRATLGELVPSFRPLDATFRPLSKAITDGTTVKFKYRKPNNEIEVRELAPWRFLNVEGEWLIQGWNYERKAVRNFLLKRIVDKKISTTSQQSYRPATVKDIAEADRDLAEFRASKVAKLRVLPGTAAWSHFEMDFEDGDVKDLQFMDEELLAMKLRRYSNQIEILEPESLINEVVWGLEKVAAEHA